MIALKNFKGKTENYIPRWDKLQRIRSLNVYSLAKWSFIGVPIFSTIIATLYNYAKLRIILPVDLGLQYFSALMFLAASILLDIFCPEVIKQHITFREYRKFIVSDDAPLNLSSNSKSQFINDEMEVLLEQILKSDGSEETLSATAEATMRLAFAEQMSPALVENAAAYWKSMNESIKLIRVIVLTGFIISGLIAAYISFIDAPSRVFKALGL